MKRKRFSVEQIVAVLKLAGPRADVDRLEFRSAAVHDCAFNAANDVSSDSGWV